MSEVNSILLGTFLSAAWIGATAYLVIRYVVGVDSPPEHEPTNAYISMLQANIDRMAAEYRAEQFRKGEFIDVEVVDVTEQRRIANEAAQ